MALCSHQVRATVVPLGFGWEAEVADHPAYVVQLNPSVTQPRFAVGVTYTEVPAGGAFTPCDIIFRQIAPDEATTPVWDFRLAATNSTPIAWTGYALDVLSGGQA